MPEPKSVAAVITEYRDNSHADVIIGKILDGYEQDGGPGPLLRLAAMYVDQFPQNDMARAKAKEHDVPMFDTIEKAVTVGSGAIPVDGVLIVGEHGDYPHNTKGQHCYPRPRFFEDVTATFRKYGRTVPLFSDKHLAYNWHNAKWMYETAREMHIPFMAGSSLPVAWRLPALALPMGCEIEEALVIGYGGLEAYGFHTLETLQCQVERRRGGETGVAAVQSLQGDAVWQAEKQGRWSRTLFDAVMATFPQAKRGTAEAKLGGGAFYFIEYADGTRATAAVLGNHDEWGFAAKLKGRREPLACWFGLQDGKPFGHFGHLVTAVQRMVQTGHPSYPVERTLLTTGILDAVMTSLFDNQRRQETPYLDVRYRPVDYPFPEGPPPPARGA